MIPPFESPALRTTLGLLAPLSTIVDRGEYVSVRSDEEPGFIFGTMLAWRRPPGPGDEVRWRERFRAEFAHLPEVRHEAYAWQGGEPDPGALAAFLADRFEYQADAIMECAEVRAPERPARDIDVRVLVGDADWSGVAEIDAFEPPEGIDRAEFRASLARRTRRRRWLTEQGHARWFGAFTREGRLVASLGIGAVGDTARYQSVGTDAAFRRRGIAGTLVHAAAAHVAASDHPRRFVLVAEPEGPAIGLYRSLGFERTGTHPVLFRPPVTPS